MATITEVEKLAFELPENERATLAALLLESLTPVSHHDVSDEEVDRRDAEMDADPTLRISLEQLDQMVKDRLK